MLRGATVARRRARELAFRALFQSDRGSSPLLEVWQGIRAEALSGDEDYGQDYGQAYGDHLDSEGLDFAERLVKAFDTHRAEIDDRLEHSLEGWSFNQMAQTDLTVLRLALTEFLYFSDIPNEVTIEIAVRIAKKFGGEESGRFVNGVLARFYRALQAPVRG